MKAIVIKKPGEICIEDRKMPVITASQVLVRVKAAGICGSDVHIYHGKNAFATYPRIVGHEFVGEVVSTGALVTKFSEGNRVVVDPVISCGTCYSCKIGRHNVCKNLHVMGVHEDGGFQEYVAVEEKQLYILPDGISWEHAAMIEPYSIAAQVINRGKLAEDDHVLICGAGPIGLVILQAVKQSGAKAAVMDILDKRLDMAKNLGADCVINSKTMNVKEMIRIFTNNDGASLIFEATGNIHVLETCIHDLTAPAGRIVVLGFGQEPASIPQIDIMSKELDILGTRLNNHRFPQVLDWFKKGIVYPEKIISHVFKFEDAEKAFSLTQVNPEDVCKIVLKF